MALRSFSHFHQSLRKPLPFGLARRLCLIARKAHDTKHGKDRQGAIRSLVQEGIRNDPGKKALAAGKEIGEGLLEIAGVPGI